VQYNEIIWNERFIIIIIIVIMDIFRVA